jgi:tol-pal system protein YbgF
MFAAALVFAGFAQAQSAPPRPPGGLLGDLFGGGQSSSGGAAAGGPPSDADLVVRIDRLENHIRQLTGAIEQLQFRNQQLETAVRTLQGQAGGASAQSGVVPQRPVAQPSLPQPMPAAPSSPGRRSDVFDPSQHPNAPGAPRVLGSSGMVIANSEPGMPVDSQPVGVAGGREAGAPLDLSTVAQPGMPQGQSIAGPSLVPGSSGLGALPAPPPRNTSSTGAMAAVQPPSQSPQDEYDLAFGYMLRKDYALAETAFRNFLKQYPADRRSAEATYWLGESMFQRQQYRDAAESFLAVTTKHEKSGKAPDALFRLGQSLAALGETEAACAALSEVGRKYPRSSAGVKKGVEREQKRVHC